MKSLIQIAPLDAARTAQRAVHYPLQISGVPPLERFRDTFRPQALSATSENKTKQAKTSVF